jgi:ABC-type transporter Mla subunit MlaD
MTPLLEPDGSTLRGARRARWSIIVTFAAILAVAAFLGWKEGWFTPVEYFNFQTASSKSLHKGMAVHLSGFKIGQVGRVELQSDRSVRVELAIFRQYLGFLKTDSEVRLEPDLQLGGDAALEITGGTFRSLNAEPGARLKFRGEPQLYDQVVRVVERIEPMVDNFTALLNQARQPQSEFQLALRNLSDTTARVQAWTPGFLTRMDTALAAMDRAGNFAGTTLAPLSQADGDLQASLRDLRATSAELRNSLPPLLADLKAASTSLRASAVALEPAVNRVSAQLPDLIDAGQHTAAGAGEVVDAVKDFSLIRRKVDQTQPQPLLPTSKP